MPVRLDSMYVADGRIDCVCAHYIPGGDPLFKVVVNIVMLDDGDILSAGRLI